MNNDKLDWINEQFENENSEWAKPIAQMVNRMHAENIKKPRYSVGIDPGVNTGIALWDSKESKFVNGQIKTVGIVQALHMLISYFHEYNIIVYIEDPNQNRPVFGDKTHGQNFKKLQKIAQNVGSNKRDAQVLIEWCEYYEIPYRTVRPTSQKWDANYFKMVTGLRDSFSQHARDACRLVINR